MINRLKEAFKTAGIPAFAVFFAAFLLTGCGGRNNKFDATGTFESDETIISAEAAGTVLNLAVEEGDVLKNGQIVGLIDTVQLSLKKKQLLASVKAVLSKRPDVSVQLATIQKQIETAETEKKRFEGLVKANAATQKQLDDINAQLELLRKQYKASQSSLNITTEGLQSETLPLLAQIDQVQDQINRSIIKNPMDGTVLVKYARQNEIASTGKALYKIADLSTVTLRVYLSTNQLAQIKLGQQIKVFADDGNGGYKEYSGIISWISSKSEFTPKTIQTKDERANLVYAVKVKVKNDGYIKLGMYGEVKF